MEGFSAGRWLLMALFSVCISANYCEDGEGMAWKPFTVKITRNNGKEAGQEWLEPYHASSYPEMIGFCAYHTAKQREGSIEWQRGLSNTYEVMEPSR